MWRPHKLGHGVKVRSTEAETQSILLMEVEFVCVSDGRYIDSRKRGALSRGILRTLKGKEAIHFDADVANTVVPKQTFCKSAPYVRSSFEFM